MIGRASCREKVWVCYTCINESYVCNDWGGMVQACYEHCGVFEIWDVACVDLDGHCLTEYAIACNYAG